VKKTSKSERFWNRAAKSYEEHVNEGDEAAIPSLSTLANIFKGMIILDFVCAPGKSNYEV